MLYLEDIHNNLRNFMPIDELYKLKSLSLSYSCTGILLEEVCMKRDGADMLSDKNWKIVIHSVFENQSRTDQKSKTGPQKWLISSKNYWFQK